MIANLEINPLHKGELFALLSPIAKWMGAPINLVNVAFTDRVGAHTYTVAGVPYY